MKRSKTIKLENDFSEDSSKAYTTIKPTIKGFIINAISSIIPSTLWDFGVKEFLRLRFYFAHRNMFSKYLVTHQVRKLQIGSGIIPLEHWLNTDLFARKEIAFLDARKRFPLVMALLIIFSVSI